MLSPRKGLPSLTASALAVVLSLSAAESSFAAAEIDVSPASLPFGNQEAGTTSPAMQLTLSNTGDPNDIGTISVTSPRFSVSNDNCSGQQLPAPGSCTVDFSFAPINNNTESGQSVLIPNDDPDESPKIVPISGTGVTTSISVTPSSKDFGSILEGSMSTPEPFTVTNDGSVAVNVHVPSLDDAQFTRTNNSCVYPLNLPVSQQCTFDVTFMPASAGPQAATLTVTSFAPDSPDTASLAGLGGSPVAPTPPANPGTSAPAPKKCGKGRKLKKGKCLKKKRKRR